MIHPSRRAAATDAIVVLTTIAIAWAVCRLWAYLHWGIPSNAPILARPISGVLVAALLLRFRGERWSSLGLYKPASWPRAIVTVVLLYTVLWTTSRWVSAWLADLLPATTEPGFLTFLQGNLPATVCWIAIGWIVGGLCEEVLFRGFLLNRIALMFGGGRFALIVGAAAQAILFGSLHLYAGPLACAHAACFATVMATGYLLSGKNLWPLIVVHGTWNKDRDLGCLFRLMLQDEAPSPASEQTMNA